MRDLLAAHARFAAEGRAVGRAVVTSVWGSAPRAAGASMLVADDARFDGSVSGGCVETAVVLALQETLAAGRGRLVTYGVTHETAWQVGLACGGTIAVWMEPGVRPELLAAAATGGACLATIIGGTDALGAALLVHDDGRPPLVLPPVGSATPAEAALAELHGVESAVLGAARDALQSDDSATRTFTTPDGRELTVFLEVLPRPATLLIVGAVAVSMALVPLAKRVGFRTVVLDAREAFLTRERFPDADELIRAFPEEGFARVGVDRGTFVCVLSHDPKFDEPALELALRSPARYVGAIGSRKTQQERRATLRTNGFTDDEIARLHGPIGLDLGGREPAETALAILAELVAVRHGAREPMRSNRGEARPDRMTAGA
jgi:xanthine dehydrogenase accessory factor